MVETAEIPKKQEVIVYSDCLYKDDVSLFKNFRKKKNIKVKIVHLSADSIILKIKKEGFNTKADLVILSSLYEVQKAHRSRLFQPIQSQTMDLSVGKKFKSNDHTWFGIGINPYVFILKNDTLPGISQFGELRYKLNKNLWSTNLQTSTELVPMLGPIFQKKKRSAMVEWYMDFLENENTDGKKKDKNGIPLLTTNVLLTNYSTYAAMSKRNDTIDFQMKYVFSNQKKQGAYYNLIVAGVVKQARNFENAKILLEYISTDWMNEKINNRWNTFPIHLHQRIHPFAYQNTHFKLFQGSNSRIIVNYPYLDKIVKKKKKRQVIVRIEQPESE